AEEPAVPRGRWHHLGHAGRRLAHQGALRGGFRGDLAHARSSRQECHCRLYGPRAGRGGEARNPGVSRRDKESGAGGPMQRTVATLLFALAAALAAPSAHADAWATVTVDGITRTLTHTGFTFEQVSGIGVFLPPGGSADYSFDYSITVHDDGLASPF